MMLPFVPARQGKSSEEDGDHERAFLAPTAPSPSATALPIAETRPSQHLQTWPLLVTAAP